LPQKQITATKIDLKEQYRFLYKPSSKKVELIDAPELKFLMVDGSGDPTSDGFQNATQTLYNLSFTSKFSLNFEKGLEWIGYLPQSIYFTSTF